VKTNSLDQYFIYNQQETQRMARAAIFPVSRDYIYCYSIYYFSIMLFKLVQ